VIITKLQVAPVELDVSSESSQVEFEPQSATLITDNEHFLHLIATHMFYRAAANE